MNVSKGYIATAAVIGELAATIFEAQTAITDGNLTYLRYLAGTSISEAALKHAPKPRRGGKITPEEIARQLAAVEAVQSRFYPEVVRAAEAAVDERGKARAKLVNRKTGFARTAASRLRSWVRAGNDMAWINPATLTRTDLEVQRAPRAPSPTRLKRSVEVRSKALVAAVLALSESDKPAALAELDLLIGQLTTQMVELGGAPVRDPAAAISTRRPLKIGRSTFYPVTETQVLRQGERPS